MIPSLNLLVEGIRSTGARQSIRLRLHEIADRRQQSIRNLDSMDVYELKKRARAELHVDRRIMQNRTQACRVNVPVVVCLLNYLTYLPLVVSRQIVSDALENFADTS